MKPKALEHTLGQIPPSPERYLHPSGMTYTKGILYIIETHNLGWLIDAIASHQISPAIAKDPEQWRWQSWELSNAGHPLLHCFLEEQQQAQAAITQELWSNSFPHESLQLLLIDGCLMLASENLKDTKVFEKDIRRFLPSKEQHPSPSGIALSRGILYIANNFEFQSVIFAIATAQQTPEITENPMLRDYQTWVLSTLRSLPNMDSVLSCWQVRGEEDLVICEHIQRSQLPIKKLKLFVIDGVLMLPSEAVGL